MDKLVSNLLLIFRSRGGTEKLNKRTFDLSELITNAASHLKKRYPTKNITLNLPDDSGLKADPDQIKKAINNLLENAAKNTAPDGKIQINLRSTGKEFIFEVSDNGIGIKKELQKNIFDAFYRIEQGKGEGSGLGLAIVKWVVDAHHGKVFVKSKEGKGSAFIVILKK
ncbi:HAMP domain-containing histidine kinase [Candidatus Saganbacteria bacterium]|nr:HAMP domain-containing histidine kinase [Candidatus Saganbacteria bacterium]